MKIRIVGRYRRDDISSIFPTIQKVFSKTIASDLVSIQPMGAPTGKVFFFDSLTRKRRNGLTDRITNLMKSIF